MTTSKSTSRSARVDKAGKAKKRVEKSALATGSIDPVRARVDPRAVGLGAAVPGSFRVFRVNIEMSVEVSIDQRLVDEVMTDDWRSSFYSFAQASDLAGHLAFNLVQGRSLQSLDGFADQPGERVSVDLPLDFYNDGVEFSAVEIDGASRTP